ncbi:glycosyltransferase family 2 protein [Kaistia adipata]|uniref:glycosyltransferase family 2 protein n=1 Tax=Kaistia adipata TaxID=166954 RepID=UPI00040239A2|nr:glycosyltransferase family 2 protein [Kaistia adipata]
MRVFCLIAVRNEEGYLPGFLHHIRDHVDGIVALDDCSTDRTAEILHRDTRVASVLREDREGAPHANETSNRYRLLVEAARLGAQWVLCADADERFEESFLRRLREEAAHGERTGRHLRLVRIVNLWNAPDRFRADGRCGPRWTVRMFRVPPDSSQRGSAMHRPWFPPELDAAPQARMNAYLYHLSMMDRGDRERRFEKFRAIDPHNQHQAIGYGHLVDERDLKLKPVLPWRGYRDLSDGTPRARVAAIKGLGVVASALPDRALFDEELYLALNPDVRLAVAKGGFKSGWHHFERHGAGEGRNWTGRSFTGLDFVTIFKTWREAKS